VPATADAANAAIAVGNYYTCSAFACLDQCTPDVNAVLASAAGATSAVLIAGAGAPGVVAGGGNAAVGASGATAVTVPVGAAGTTTVPVGAGGTATVPAGAGGTTNSTTTDPAREAVTGTNWLTFSGSWAAAEAGVNGALNISGALYAFGDSCATMTWDETTRCLTGTLCEPGADFANWGVSVGFDFHNTGETGTPPNTKLPWSASAVAATGVAWAVSGTAPGLQVWVTNMDASFGSQCTVDECAINGPPDGRASTTLNGPDSMLFSGMVKDDWGGSGTTYTFDSSRILALQFKLASVVSGAASFNFCIDQIGITR
jgi:hypothetical protein